MEIILASNSARRKDLFNMLNIPFRSMDSGLDERMEEKKLSGLSHCEKVKEISRLKALKANEQLKGDRLVITADTVVIFNDIVMNKPDDRKMAVENLKMLSGKAHKVYTAYTILKDNGCGEQSIKTKICGSDVYFRNLTEDEINSYVDTKDPFDKAGGYGMQGKGALLVDKIDGDFYNIIGLPISSLYEDLKLIGINIMGFWR